MDKCTKIANLYIASLQALAIIHTHNHWITKGPNFYGNHLLFERIYKQRLENLDAGAEKLIGAFGSDCLRYDLQTQFLSAVLQVFTKFQGSPLRISLEAEKAFLKLNQEFYKLLKENSEMKCKLTLGIDDLMMSIANDCEEAVYLLQQALK